MLDRVCFSHHNVILFTALWREEEGSMQRYWALIALTVLIAGAVRGEEDLLPGLKPGTEAPAMESKAWVTADGKAPEMKGKVLLIDFWFAA
jgi:hypothetical protein